MRSYNLNPGLIMKDIYSYPFPEVREVLAASHLDPRFMLNTLDAGEAQSYLKPYGFQPRLELPARADGSLDLDEIHLPVIERIRKRVGTALPGLNGYEHAYPTHGSSQAMYTLLAEWSASGEVTSVGTLKGEYEGYAAYADSLSVPVTTYDHLEAAEPKPGELWFISNPSAVDGNYIPPDAWHGFVAKGHQIVYDAAYVGLTGTAAIDVSSPNIKAVLTSPSKIFGVFRYRHTGVVYTREPVKALYGSKWFKDVPALLDTLKLYETFGPTELPDKYKGAQRFICQSLTELAGDEIVPSDVLLLAAAKQMRRSDFAAYRRAAGYRFGLTKLFEDVEGAGGMTSVASSRK